MSKRMLSFIIAFALIIQFFSLAFSEEEFDSISEYIVEDINELNETDSIYIETKPDYTALIEKIDALVKKHNIGGMNLAIACGDKVILTYETGYLDRGRKKPVNEDSLFRSASVTKFVAALGLLKLYDEGKINLDDNISKYMKVALGSVRFGESGISARQLLTHTSSIIPSGSYNNATKPIDKVIGQNGDCEDNFYRTLPGNMYKYKNLDGGLFGSLIEALSNKSVQDYMQDNFYEQMGITASFSLSQIKNLNPDNVSDLFMKNGDFLRSAQSSINAAISYKNDCSPLYNYNITIGSLWTNAKSLLKLLIMLCNDGVYEGKQYLSEDTVRLMIMDQSTIEGSSVKLSNGPYGLSVQRMLKLGEYDWYGHQGRFEGTLAAAYYQPDTKLCFAFITNRWNNSMKEGIANFSRELVKEVEKLANKEN